MNNFAQLKESSPFYPLFPRGLVPIKNIVVPNVVECEGDGVQEVYMVDLDKLSESQFEQVLELLIRQNGWTGSKEVARKEIKGRGLPLRAKHVQTVSTDVPFCL